MPTPRLALPYIVQSQAQKEVTHNDALNLLDLMVQTAVLDRDAATPPAAPAAGDCYIVASGASGAWAGHDGQVAAWVGTAWRFVVPGPGFLVYVVDEALYVTFDGAAWLALGGSGGTGIGDIVGLSAALAGKLDDTDAALFATAAQGALADSAVQPGDLGTAATLDAGVAAGVATLDAGGKVPVSQLPEAIVGAMTFQGLWNAASNSPVIPAAAPGNLGWFYIVSNAGTTAIDGISDWQVGDWIVSTGDAWHKIDSTDQVTAVAGLTGAITASALRAALSLVVGTDVQAYSAKLAALAALVWAADNVPFFTGTGTVDKFVLSSFMRGLMSAGSAASLLSSIGALPLAGGTLTGAVIWRLDHTTAITITSASDIGTTSCYAQRARGTLAAPAALQPGDFIYNLVASGYHSGGAFSSPRSLIRCSADEAFTSGAQGTRVGIYVTAAGTTSENEVLRASAAKELQMHGANTVLSADRLHRLRVVTIATLSALVPAQGDLVYVSDLGGGGGVCVYNGTMWVRLKETGQQTVATDAALSLAYLANAPALLHTGTLTADRSMTLPASNVPSGARFHIARTGGGVFNLNINAATTKALTTNSWCIAEYNGGAWNIIATGSL